MNPATPEQERIGLELDPFPVNGPDGCFISRGALGKRLDLLHHLTQYSELILVLTGAEGAGKTTLLGALLDDAQSHWHCCVLNGRNGLEPMDLVDELARGFDLPDRGGDIEATLNQIDNHLASLERARQVVLIAVDDFDRLDPPTREALMELWKRWEPLRTRLLLVGRGEGDFASGEPPAWVPAESEAVHAVDLPLLDAPETGTYVRARLARAGLEGDGPFSARVIGEIHSLSGGVPAEIHRVARTVIERIGSSPGAPLRVPRSGKWPRIAIAVVAVLTAIAWVGLGMLNDGADEPTMVAEGTAPDASDPTAAQEAAVRRAREQAEAALKAREAALAKEKAREEAEAEKQAREKAEAEKLAREKAEAEKLAREKAEAEKLAREKAEAEKKAREKAAAAKRAREKAAAAKRAREKAAADKKARQSQPAGDPGPLRDLAWLSTQPRGNYVIQLIGSRSMDPLRRYAKRYRLGSRASWFETRHQGAPWFVLVYGSYPSRDAAAAAIEGLDERLRAGSPWPRQVGDILDRAVGGG